ncbi:flagellar basal body L-ring protein FlgH [Hellea sp.]|nr:flagellar basal body L-ring protein FlgH [Hellea sp.]
MTHFTLKPLVKPMAAFCILALSACASTNNLETPKSFPDNWNAPRGNYIDAPPVLRGELPVLKSSNANVTSLWSSSPKSLFGDRRASKNGDLLTVVIEIDDEAEIQNSVTQSRQTDQDFLIGALFGLPEFLTPKLPDGAGFTPAVDIARGSNVNGNGNIKRQETMTLRLAARVVDVLPNGYLSLVGRQEIMVNNEARYLQVTGLIRTQDISRLNTITYDKIAEARVYYGGQGQITDSVRPRKGNKILSKILPF